MRRVAPLIVIAVTTMLQSWVLRRYVVNLIDSMIAAAEAEADENDPQLWAQLSDEIHVELNMN